MEITFVGGRRAPAVGAQCRLVKPANVVLFRYHDFAQSLNGATSASRRAF